ncbi:hypothetical protein LJB42_000466 [Komagataella kurtzmanii]|nr:hypothetical protein LJB42_000466 [Komagataella kurtzmanii]
MTPESSELLSKLLKTLEDRTFDSAIIADSITSLSGDTSLHEDTDGSGRSPTLKLLAPKLLDVTKDTSVTIDQHKSTLNLWEALFTNLTFNCIIEEIPLVFILDSINSGNSDLVLLAIKVVLKADPIDSIANTSIIKHLISLLGVEDTPVSVVNGIENFINIALLTGGDLIKRRFTSTEIISILLQMKRNESETIQARLYEVVFVLLTYTKQEEIPQDLYLITENQFNSLNDILLKSLIIQFYTRLLKLAHNSDHSKDWLLRKIRPQYQYILKLFFDPEYHGEEKFLLVPEAVKTIATLSYINDGELFNNLEEKHSILSTATDSFYGDGSVLLLSDINPTVLIPKYQTFISSLPLRASLIPIIKNLITTPETFSFLSLPTTSLRNLPMLELFDILSSVSAFEYSSQVLLQEWPSIMRNLLDENVSITEPEVRFLKRLILENLLQYNASVLGIWSTQIKRVHRELISGKRLEAQPVLGDSVS